MSSTKLIFSILIIFCILISCSKNNSTNPSANSSAGELSISFPVNNSVVGGVINITASVGTGLSIDKIEFYINSNLEYTAYNSPFQYQWDTRNYNDSTFITIQLKGYEGSELIVTSDSITVQVDNSGGTTDTLLPTVNITYPTNGAQLLGTVTITIEAFDNIGVTDVGIYVDGEFKNSDYSYEWKTNDYPNGSHTIYAKAWDNAGNEGISEMINVTINNAVDATLPTITITYPINNSTISGEIRVSGSAHDNDKLKRVYLYIDGAIKKYYNDLNSSSCSIYYDWDTNFELDGLHNIYVDAKDQSGNQTISPQLLVTSQNSIAIGKNAILNGGFEQSNNSDFWDINLMGNFIQDANIAHSGNCCFQGLIDGATTVTPFHIEKNQKYKLEFWVKGECNNIKFYLLYSKSNYSFSDCLEMISTSINSNDWYKFSTEVLITKDVDLSKIKFWIENNLYIDDISFTRIQ